MEYELVTYNGVILKEGMHVTIVVTKDEGALVKVHAPRDAAPLGLIEVQIDATSFARGMYPTAINARFRERSYMPDTRDYLQSINEISGEMK